MAKQKSKQKGMDLGKVLLWSAVLVEAPRWAGAMLAADVSEIAPWMSTTLNVANSFAGAFMGILVVVATAYLFDALRGMKPDHAAPEERGCDQGELALLGAGRVRVRAAGADAVRAGAIHREPHDGRDDRGSAGQSVLAVHLGGDGGSGARVRDRGSGVRAAGAGEAQFFGK